MSCPHGLYSRPDRCSQCLGVVPQVVSVDATTIDGKPSGRTLDPQTERKFFAHRVRKAKP